MKKTLLTILAGLPALVFAQTNYTIKGNVKALNAPAKIFLLYRLDGKTIMDSTLAVNGAFTFNGTVKDITSANLVADYKGVDYTKMDRKVKRDVVQLYLAEGTTNVASADSLSKATVSGTKVNEDNTLFKAAIKPASDKMDKLNAEYAATPVDIRKSKEYNDAYDAKYDVIDKEQMALSKEFIKAHPASAMSLLALGTAGGAYPEYADMAPLFNNLSADIKNSPNGQAYAARLEKIKLVALGATASEFAQADTAGKMISLSSFRGKYLLVDFWASWCGPCRAENPNVVKTFNKFKDKNFTILGVSLDQPGAKDKWLAAIHKDGLTWTHVSDLKYWNNEVSSAYGVQAIPQNYLLDPSGKIIGKNLFGKDLESKLEEIFGKI